MFAQWGDTDLYALAPGGDFESTLGWKGTGDARLYKENDPFNLSGPGATSVYLEGAATVTSPAICVDETRPFLRYMTRAIWKGNQTKIRVEALWTDADGPKSLLLDEMSLKGYTEWGPSPQVPLGAKLPLKGVDSLNVQLRFSLANATGDWLVDNVFIDPRASR